MPKRFRAPSDQFLDILNAESISFKHGAGFLVSLNSTKGINMLKTQTNFQSFSNDLAPLNLRNQYLLKWSAFFAFQFN